MTRFGGWKPSTMWSWKKFLFSSDFPSCLSCCGNSKQWFNIIGVYSFLRKYVSLRFVFISIFCFFSPVFYDCLLFSPITFRFFNLCVTAFHWLFQCLTLTDISFSPAISIWNLYEAKYFSQYPPDAFFWSMKAAIETRASELKRKSCLKFSSETNFS